MRKVERIARGRTRRAETALARQVFAALDGLRRDQSQEWLERVAAGSRQPIVESLPNRLAPAMATIRKAFMSGYRDGKAVLARADAVLKGSFTGVDPFAVTKAQRHAGALVTQVTEETRKAIRDAITKSIAEGVTPKDTAKTLRQVVGLTSGQATAVVNLKKLDAKGASNAVKDKATTAYADKLLRFRAETIARTEIMRAQNAGQRAAWDDAVAKGQIGAQSSKVWIVAPDDRLCPNCEPMGGETAPLNGVFSGGVSEPPLHPRCRCTVGLVPASVPRVVDSSATRNATSTEVEVTKTRARAPRILRLRRSVPKQTTVAQADAVVAEAKAQKIIAAAQRESEAAVRAAFEASEAAIAARTAEIARMSATIPAAERREVARTRRLSARAAAEARLRQVNMTPSLYPTPGTSPGAAEALHSRNMALLTRDQNALAVLQEGNVTIALTDGGVTMHPSMAPFRNQRPRGWDPGSTWDQVVGVYNNHQNSGTVIVGWRGSGGSAGSVLAHEAGHGVEHAMTLVKQDMKWLKKAESVWSQHVLPAPNVKPYFKQTSPADVKGSNFTVFYPAGLQETFAESWSMHTHHGMAEVARNFGPEWTKTFQRLVVDVQRTGRRLRVAQKVQP